MTAYDIYKKILGDDAHWIFQKLGFNSHAKGDCCAELTKVGNTLSVKASTAPITREFRAISDEEYSLIEIFSYRSAIAIISVSEGDKVTYTTQAGAAEEITRVLEPDEARVKLSRIKPMAAALTPRLRELAGPSREMTPGRPAGNLDALACG